MGKKLYLLFESAAGLALFLRKKLKEKSYEDVLALYE